LYKRWLLGSVILAVVVGIAGCGNSPVAVVNGVRITESEFNKRLVRNFGRDTLSDMIDRQLIKQMAEEEGLTVSEEDLNKEIEETKKQFPTEQDFIRWLASRNMSEEEWREALKMAMLTRELALKDVKYAEKDLKAFFNEHKDRYAVPTLVSLSEIVVASSKDAQEVLAEIKKGEASFGDLARVYSLAPYTKARGGKRREDTPLERVMPQPIRVAANKLAVGEVSDPIPAEGQWYIVKLDDRKPAREAGWEKDKDRVKRDYEGAHAKPLRSLLDDAIEKSNVQIVDPRFQELNEIYMPVPTDMPEFGPAGAKKEPAEEAPANATGESGS